MAKKKKKEDKIMSTNDALKSRGNLKDMTPEERKKYIKNRIKNMSSSDTDKVTRSLGLGSGRGGLSMKAQLEGNLPGKKKYKSGGMVKKSRDGIAKRGKTKGRFI